MRLRRGLLIGENRFARTDEHAQRGGGLCFGGGRGNERRPVHVELLASSDNKLLTYWGRSAD